MARYLNVAIVLLAGALWSRPALAQEKECNFLCSPIFIAQTPALVNTNVFDQTMVRDTATGEVFELEENTEFLIRFGVAIPTTIPRTTLWADFQWTPWAGAATNPFTGKTFGPDEVDANNVNLVYGVLIDLVKMEQTDGWFGSTLDLLGVLTPAAEPDDERFYTHKFVPELYVNLALFNWLPKGNWIRNVTAYGLLDYIATGLAEEGDVVGGLEFLEDASRWVILFGLQWQIAPLPR